MGRILLFACCMCLGSLLLASNKSNVADVEMSDDYLAVVYLACGNANLLSGDYGLAVQDFEKTSFLLSKLKDRYPEFEFLALFGKVIAYDNLHDFDQAEQALGTLFILINESESVDLSEVLERPSPAEDKEAVEIMRKLASLASSPQIRDILLFIIDEMSEELISQFQLSDSFSWSQQAWDYDYGNDECVELSKSFWKRTKKIFVKLPQALQWIARLIHGIKEVNKALEK